MNQEGTLQIKDSTGNPAPLGLYGFALTTILLNIHNIGVFPLDSMIMAMGIFYGGLAQVIVGIMEWKKKNTFGTVAFTSYGFFWMTLVGLMILPKLGWGLPATSASMAAYLAVWGLFSLILFVGTLTSNKAIQFVFGTLVILFALLSIGDALESVSIKHLAGYVGIICGLSAMYLASAEVLNEMYGKTILPIGAKK